MMHALNLMCPQALVGMGSFQGQKDRQRKVVLLESLSPESTKCVSSWGLGDPLPTRVPP